jgi:beta-N-acetylhexosaminidase
MLAASQAVRPLPATGAGASTCTNRARLATWSDRRLALLTIAVPVSEASPEQVVTEVRHGVGGVVLVGSSAPSDLGSRLAELESNVPGHRGLLVMTDEEGGGIQRVANLVGSLPWPAWMGEHWTPAEIEHAVARVSGRMAAINVNMDLAPVVDVDGTDAPPSSSNPDGWRSFSGRTPVVSRDGIAFMKGLAAGHVIAVLKHFPGLGGSSANSDDGPAHTLPWSTLRGVAIPPFANAIARGAPAIMVANDTVPGLTSLPAGLSRTVIREELEGTLGFHGLVMTDALNAKAISSAGYTIPQAAVQALRAGADMVLFGPGPNAANATRGIASAAVDAVADGSLSHERLVDAAASVLAVRDVSLCSS